LTIIRFGTPPGPAGTGKQATSDPAEFQILNLEDSDAFKKAIPTALRR
jgi:hypothetical protein